MTSERARSARIRLDGSSGGMLSRILHRTSAASGEEEEASAAGDDEDDAGGEGAEVYRSAEAAKTCSLHGIHAGDAVGGSSEASPPPPRERLWNRNPHRSSCWRSSAYRLIPSRPLTSRRRISASSSRCESSARRSAGGGGGAGGDAEDDAEGGDARRRLEYRAA
jgi:hypothetical protein